MPEFIGHGGRWRSRTIVASSAKQSMQVSTVDLGEEEFETVVFDSPSPNSDVVKYKRYATKQAARAGHARHCKWVMAQTERPLPLY